jgi:hypothetical protein
MAHRIALPVCLVLLAVAASPTTGCTASSSSASSCQIGGACSNAETCMGGVAGCASNCQCLEGVWRAPCPQDVPSSGSACTTEGATCGYLTDASACEGSVDCDCQGGTWSCAPTCVVPLEDGGSNDGNPSAGDDAGHSQPTTALPACHWPASLDDAGPGACGVGRAYVKCTYPSGVSCEAGGGASSPGGLTMLCLSDDPTSCAGCVSIAGAATCTDMCAPDEYAVSCGGPPQFSNDGGSGDFAYQEPPANCVGVGGTPAGNAYFCCPCE